MRGVSLERQTAVKTQWRAAADIVLAGDSRANHGLQPQAFAAALDNARTLNFAFRAVGYSPRYLDAIENVLDSDGAHPTIVLGITALTLTAGACNRNEFEHELSRSWPDRQLRCYAGDVLHQVDVLAKPYTLDRALEQLGVLRLPPEDWISEEHIERLMDGFAAVRVDGSTPKSVSATLDQYRRTNFRGNPVDEQVIATLLERVRQWRQRGVLVVALYPPVPPEMLQIEREQAQFDHDAFRQLFVDAGGVWVEAPMDEYCTYDASHLILSSAERLSDVVADRVRQCWETASVVADTR